MTRETCRSKILQNIEIIKDQKWTNGYFEHKIAFFSHLFSAAQNAYLSKFLKNIFPLTCWTSIPLAKRSVVIRIREEPDRNSLIQG